MGCKYHDDKKCNVIRANSLTQSEQEKLIKFTTAKFFRKFSTVSLMYYCRRKNLLNISLDSWYKYLRLYEINRKHFVSKKQRRYKRGIRASVRNQIWHIDITEVSYKNSKRAYLQLVVDNYSRLIVAWNLSHYKKALITKKSLLKSFKFSPEFCGDILSDGGSENIANDIQNIIWGRGIRHIIAKQDVQYSNSMVEAVFRQLKQKFLIKDPTTYRGLYQQIYKFVKQYNNVIPHSSLNGATPNELYNGTFNKREFKHILKIKLFEQRKIRREKFHNCQKCQKKYFREQSFWS